MSADIEATAVELLREYGEIAWLHASQRVDECTLRGDIDGQHRWDAILQAIYTLEGPHRRTEEREY